MNSYNLIIDDRERDVYKYFFNSEDIKNKKLHLSGSFKPFVNIIIKRIHIGDYCIMDKNNLYFIIERKTWKDLADSIKDNRISNLKKMQNLSEKYNSQENKPIIIYLIQGPSRYKSSHQINRIPFKNLQAYLDNLIIKYNIHIIYAKDCNDVINRILEFIQTYDSFRIKESRKYKIINVNNINIDKINANETCNNENNNETCNNENNNEIKAGSIMEILLTPIKTTEEEIINSIWCCIPYITNKTSSFFQNNWHISDLILNKISRNEIKNMKYSNGRIFGEKNTKKIHSVIWKDEYFEDFNNICKINKSKSNPIKIYIKILECVPGITKKTAKIILSSLNFKLLLNGFYSIDTVANIYKTEKTKIGTQSSKNIFKYLVKPIKEN